MNEEQRHIEQLEGQLDELEKKIEHEGENAEQALHHLRKRSSGPESMQAADPRGEGPHYGGLG
jgi:hypothetical protein